MSDSARSAPATLSDVAREAGVSLATASRVLNGSTRVVGGELRERVEAASARLGYTPNLSAQATARGTTSTVALIVSDIADPYFSSIASGVIRGADEHGLLLTMGVTERRSERELELVRTLRGQRPRVLILAGSRSVGDAHETALLAELRAVEETGGRAVIVSQGELPFDTVIIDNYSGARRLAEELVAQGYRRFAVVEALGALMTSRDRVRGFLDGLAGHGLSVADEHRVAAEFTRDGGHAAAAELLGRGLDGVDLVFAVSDVMAIGVLRALREAGVPVPATLGVAGFDDISTASDVSPALSTVRLPLEQIGAAAVELAINDRVGGDRALVRIDGDVILRASTQRTPRA